VRYLLLPLEELSANASDASPYKLRSNEAIELVGLTRTMRSRYTEWGLEKEPSETMPDGTWLCVVLQDLWGTSTYDAVAVCGVSTACLELLRAGAPAALRDAQADATKCISAAAYDNLAAPSPADNREALTAQFAQIVRPVVVADRPVGAPCR